MKIPEVINQSENENLSVPMKVMPSMIDSLTQHFTFEFPWVGKSESTEDLGDNSNADIEDKTISKGATLFEQQTSKDLPAVEENCCPELCLELSGEARNIAK